MSARSDIPKFPKFKDSYEKHCVHRTYYFHVHICNDDTCQYHGLSTCGEITALGDPVLVQGEYGKEHYERGSDPEEKFMPSPLHDPSKRPHGM